MPTTIADWTIGDIAAWLAAISGIGLVVWRLWGPFKAIKQFLEHWNGRPEQKDWSGKVLSEAKPGVPAMLGEFQTELAEVQKGLKEVITQVSNHHTTNLRDDVSNLQRSVESINGKLSEHIKISKHYDAAQEETKKKLDDHIKETEGLMPMLHDLHEEWVMKRHPKHSDD